MSTELDTAKEEALADADEPTDAVDEVVEEVEEEVVEEVEEDVEEILPTDHKERSQMGRKLAALFKKNDKLEEVVLQQAEVLQRLLPQEDNEEEDLPVTRKELNQMMNQQQQASTQYEDEFKSTFHQMCEANDLSAEEAEGVGELLLTKFNNRVVGDGKLDGAMNFEKARSAYFQKTVPLKKSKAPGVIKKQVSTPKESKLTKLDEVSQSYYNFVKRTDGEEAAMKLHKSL